MVGWLIVLGILALLLGLLLSPFSFAWDYDAPKDRFFWKLSWLGISFADSAGKGLFQREKEESRKPEKEPEKRKKKKRKKPKKSRRPAKKKSPESSERDILFRRTSGKRNKRKKERKAKAGTRLGFHQGQPVRASETAAAAVEGHLSETAGSGRAGGTVRCTGMCPRLRSSQCGSVHRCGTAGQCHAVTGAADTGAVCVRAGVFPLGRPRKAAPLFSGGFGGTVQLCRRLCDAEKPAGN